MANKDKTLLDNNRTLLNLQKAEIGSVLPEFYGEEYPNLITLFDKYYEWMDSSSNPSGQIKRLYASRDVTQVPTPLLVNLEDELLLGQAYFGGFINKREAIKRSNLLYRSKGTKYSIEQFFRAFFGIDPVVLYPKENIFKVGPSIDYTLDSINSAGEQIKEEASKLGPESRKYITDDKLYQVLSILIRVGIPLKDWIDVYKLFVHPAGTYIGAELLIEIVNLSWDGVENTRGLYDNGGIAIIQEDEGTAPSTTTSATYIATAQLDAFIAQTYLLPGDDNQPIMRQDILATISGNTNTIEELSSGYTLRELLSPNSITFDDSDTGTASGGITDAIDFSQDSALDRAALITERFSDHKYSTQFDSA